MTDVELCTRCPHPFNPHVICGDFTAPDLVTPDIAVAGWMECPEPGCECWSTWSFNHPAMSDELRERIDAYLDGLRRGREIGENAHHS